MQKTVRVKVHRIFVRIVRAGADEEFIFPAFEQTVGDEVTVNIPKKILFSASYLYDLTAKKLLKDKLGKVLVPLGVKEVDREWLANRGYIVMAGSNMPTGTDKWHLTSNGGMIQDLRVKSPQKLKEPWLRK